MSGLEVGQRIAPARPLSIQGIYEGSPISDAKNNLASIEVTGLNLVGMAIMPGDRLVFDVGILPISTTQLCVVQTPTGILAAFMRAVGSGEVLLTTSPGEIEAIHTEKWSPAELRVLGVVRRVERDFALPTDSSAGAVTDMF